MIHMECSHLVQLTTFCSHLARATAPHPLRVLQLARQTVVRIAKGFPSESPCLDMDWRLLESSSPRGFCLRAPPEEGIHEERASFLAGFLYSALLSYISR